MVVTIASLDKRGQGVSTCGITVPFTLPGEKVEIELIETRDKTWGQIIQILEPSPSRTQPQCMHYGTCGGCSLQHLDAHAYSEFKKNIVAQALAAEGLAVAVNDPILIGPHNRRRIDFLTRKFPDGMNMGFYQINSRRRINLQQCPVVEPAIEALFSPLERLLDQILDMRELVHIFILKAENGIDLLLAGFKRELTPEQIQLCTYFAQQNQLARLSYKIKRRTHVLFEHAPPHVRFAGQPMAVNPNVFLQASHKADLVLSQQVVEALPQDARKVIDLFCGRGTLTLPIWASGRQVYGYEGDKHAIAALNELQLEGLKAEVRDLFETPLTAEELQGTDAVVMNPPRSGVKNQVTHLIEAQVPVIVYVSCNPETFARDMRALADGGYTVTSVTPVDQFTWSHHLEVVGVAVWER